MFEDVLCVIPARAGSKGIPNKNMVCIRGIPLVSYSTRHALEAEIPAQNIIVSSDGQDILEVARADGVTPYRRPAEYAQDHSSTESVLVNILEQPEYTHIRNVLLLQPTSPIRLRNRVKDCLLAYLKGGYDSLLTVTKFPNMFWKQSQKDGRQWSPTYNPAYRKRKQELAESDFLYFENGNIYVTATNILWEKGCRVGNKVCVYPITEVEGMQIDTPTDLRIISKILEGGRQEEDEHL